MDNELFELCKEVYQKLRWIDYDAPKSFVMDVDGEWSLRETQRGKTVPAWYPLYTSDYLLGKLPSLNAAQQYLLMETSSLRYAFGYAEYGELIGTSAISDTPLKALLKLIISLHEAGELA